MHIDVYKHNTMHHPCTDPCTAQLARQPQTYFNPTKPIRNRTTQSTWYSCCILSQDLGKEHSVLFHAFYHIGQLQLGIMLSLSGLQYDCAKHRLQKEKEKRRTKKEQKQRSEIKGTNFLVYFFSPSGLYSEYECFFLFFLHKKFFVFILYIN